MTIKNITYKDCLHFTESNEKGQDFKDEMYPQGRNILWHIKLK